MIKLGPSEPGAAHIRKRAKNKLIVNARWTSHVICHPLKKKNQYTMCTASVVVNISASCTSFFGDVSVAQMVASVSGVVLGGVAEIVGSNLARGKIFTASIGSVDSLYPSVFIYCLNLHQFLTLCSSKAMMFVKLYFRTSDIYLISLVSLDPSGFHLRTK